MQRERGDRGPWLQKVDRELGWTMARVGLARKTALEAPHRVETARLLSAARSLTLYESHRREKKNCDQHKRREDQMPTGLARVLELRMEWCQASMLGAYLRRHQTRAATNAKWSPFPQTDSSRGASTNFPRSHSRGRAIRVVDSGAESDIWEQQRSSSQKAAAVIRSWAASEQLDDGNSMAEKGRLMCYPCRGQALLEL